MLAGDTPLIDAARRGRVGVVEELLAYGADVNQARKGVTPLCAACYNGHTEVVTTLLAKGRRVNEHLRFE